MGFDKDGYVVAGHAEGFDPVDLVVFCTAGGGADCIGGTGSIGSIGGRSRRSSRIGGGGDSGSVGGGLVDYRVCHNV